MFANLIGLLNNGAQWRKVMMVGVAVMTIFSLNSVSFTQSGRRITPVAGTGVCGLSGDGGIATNAQVNRPNGLCFDVAGNIYIADLGNHVIRKVTPYGTITTVAGTGVAGYNGDNKLATNAQLAAPTALAVDPTGRYLYIVDNGNHCIRRLDVQSATITTFAGTPQQSGFEGDGKLATEAKFKSPSAIAMDGLGNMYIGDYLNYRVRKIDFATGIITTVAGNGRKGYAGDNGLATLASFKGVAALAISPSGDLFIADNEDHRVRKVSNGVMTTFAGNGSFTIPTPGGPATASSIKWPQGLAFGFNGNLYVSDNSSHTVFSISPTGMLSVVAGTGTPGYNMDNIPANEALLYGPSGLATDRFGNLAISDTLNCRVRRVNAQ